jgi:hypothetical protein
LLSVKSAAYTDANLKEIKIEVHPRLLLSNRPQKEVPVVEPKAPKDVARATSPAPTRLSVAPGEVAKATAGALVTDFAWLLSLAHYLRFCSTSRERKGS